jgi:hypothetical protein
MVTVKDHDLPPSGSIYTSGTQYNMTAAKLLTTEGDIRPEIGRWPKDDCDPGCVSVTPIIARAATPCRGRRGPMVMMVP